MAASRESRRPPFWVVYWISGIAVLLVVAVVAVVLTLD